MIALTPSAVELGYKVLYREAQQLVEDITEARELGVLRNLRAQIAGVKIPVMDDLFLRKLPAHAGEERADVIMARHAKGSTLIASTPPIGDWTRLSGDVVLVTPLLHRLMRPGHFAKFKGKAAD
ncbi:MAG: ATP-binding protein [Gemmatimonadaceae bacterium]